MERQLLRDNIVGAITLLKRTEAWLAGGLLMVLAVIQSRILVEAAAPADLDIPGLARVSFLILVAIALVEFCGLAILSRTLHPKSLEFRRFEWPRAIPAILLCVALPVAIEAAIDAIGHSGHLRTSAYPGLAQWITPFSDVVLLPFMVRVACVSAGNAYVGVPYIIRRLCSHFASWFGGFFLLAMGGQALRIGARVAVVQYSVLAQYTPTTAGIFLISAATGVSTLVLFLYAVRTAQIIAAGTAADPAEVFE